MKTGLTCLLLGLSALSFGCEKGSSKGEKVPESSADDASEARAEGHKVAGSSDARREEPTSDATGVKSPTPSGGPTSVDAVEKSGNIADQERGLAAAPAAKAASSMDAAAAARPSPASKGDPRRPANTFAPLGAESPEATACDSDSDCTVSCYYDGRCCQELCGCSRVYHRAFASRLAQAVAQNCSSDVRCPVARCVGTKGGRAVCEQGSCVLAKKEGQVDAPPKVSSP